MMEINQFFIEMVYTTYIGCKNTGTHTQTTRSSYEACIIYYNEN